MSLKEWKKLVCAPVAVVLKQRGFRKVGMKFSKKCQGVTHVVSLQSGKWTTAEQLVITCNLEIWVDQLDSWNPIWHERIGSYCAEAQDYWWNCSSDDEARIAGEEIAALLEKKALPVMETLTSPSAIASLWSAGRSPGLTQFSRDKYLAQLKAAGVTFDSHATEIRRLDSRP